MTRSLAPRKSDPDPLLALDQQLCFALYAASRSVVRGYRPHLDELDLTYPQYLVMLVLWEWERTEQAEHCTVSALGQRLDLDSGTLTPLLRRLESKGLVRRRRSSEDERELLVQLTEDGRGLSPRARKVALAILADPPLPLPKLLALREGLKQLRAAIAPIDQ